MDPMVVDGCLFPILTHTDVPETGLAGEPHPIHQDVNTRLVCDYITSGTFHPGAVLLQ